jgi:hypothetical protein
MAKEKRRALCSFTDAPKKYKTGAYSRGVNVDIRFNYDSSISAELQ